MIKIACHDAYHTLNIKDQSISQTRSSRFCVFWNEDTLQWSDEGCHLDLDSDSANTVCVCDHTTNFAVIFDVDGSLNEMGGTALLVLNVLSNILCGFSAFGCLVTFLVLQFSK